MVGSGKAFGKLDDNIQGGMPVDKAADMILKAVKLRRNEVFVSGWGYRIIPRLAFLSETINDLCGYVKYKSQIKVMNKAKQE